MIGIEHPDHTGASANPDAPWNQGDPEQLICEVCQELDTEGANPGDPCPVTFMYDDGSGHDTPYLVDCAGTLRQQEK